MTVLNESQFGSGNLTPLKFLRLFMSARKFSARLAFSYGFPPLKHLINALNVETSGEHGRLLSEVELLIIRFKISLAIFSIFSLFAPPFEFAKALRMALQENVDILLCRRL